MNRKVYALALYLGFMSGINAHSQWEIEICKVKENLNAIFFTDVSSGWIIGNNGTILKYTDNQWSEFPSPTKNDLFSITMLNENDGWIVGEKGTILHFTGQQWELCNSPTNENLYSVDFSDHLNGLSVGSMGVLLYYNKLDWKLFQSDFRFNLFTVRYQNEDAWIGGCREGIAVPIMKMRMNPEMESVQTYSISEPISSMFMLDEFNGWAVGAKNQILHFNGNAWEHTLINDDFPAMRSVFFEDENNGITVGYSGNILVFKFGRWIKEESVTNQQLNAAFIINGNYYAVGNGGTIMSKKVLVNVQVDRLSSDNADEQYLFPNPCDVNINLCLSVGKNNNKIQISISNSEGQIIETKEFRVNAGEFNYNIPTSDFNDGVYFATIRMDDKTETKQFLVRHRNQTIR